MCRDGVPLLRVGAEDPALILQGSLGTEAGALETWQLLYCFYFLCLFS